MAGEVSAARATTGNNDSFDDFPSVQRKSSLPWIIAGVNIVALMAVAGYLLFKDDQGTKHKEDGAAVTKSTGKPSVDVKTQEEPISVGDSIDIGTLVKLENFIVNLNEPGANRYLKVGIDLELKNSAAQDLIEKLKPVLRDRTIAYLSSLSFAQTQGLVAKERIRLELLNRFNGTLGRPIIRNIYFTDFLIQ
ncbi:MAG: flagellar basal body-associated FliL family protein [Deltaproteobacteria bacterium]|nr:flagellar basal body-associated FliL family protein [Deltaproteobacteria bacterium]